MAEVPITINGVICDLYGRTITGPIKLVGSASITGLGVGGGPIIPPPDSGGGGDKPGGIWGGGNVPMPTPPIANVPGLPPTQNPPGWGDGPPVDPPPGGEDGPGKPPPPDGGWGWHPDYGWGYFPGNGGKPQPPGR